MKRRIVTILLLVMLLPLGLVLFGASLPEYYGESYYAQLPELYEKLKSTEGKKVVVLGGSNVAFGMNSAQMEQILADCGYDYTVCNFGLYAAVGTGAMLELSDDYLTEGDIVILAIEPTSETFSSYFGATAFWKCAETKPEMVLELNRSQQSNLVGNYISYVQERAEIHSSGILPQADGVYAKASFDENGDMVYDRAGNAMLLGYDTANPIDLANVVLEESFVEQVNEYILAAQRNGATVLMSFSPMNRGAMVDVSEETIYSYFCKLQESFSCRIISDPNSYIMDSGWFFDSNFHLNNAGAAIRTHQLACDLLNYLGCFRDVPFVEPEMPDSIARMPEDYVESTDFLFEPVGENGFRVSGLTEEGNQKNSLVVPSVHDGKPVVEISAEAFSGNTTITELTLPETIAAIPDGAFRGCDRLVRLVLLHRSTTPAVGDGLLEGADDLVIYVPSDAYHLYRDGAGCAVNPWEGFLNRIVTY